jgi:hypothetical protein
MRRNFCTVSAFEKSPRFEMMQHRDVQSSSSPFIFMSHFKNKVTMGRLLAEARRAVGAESAFLYAMEGQKVTILGIDGFSLLDASQLAVPTIERLLYGARAFEYLDMALMKEFATAALVHDQPGWRYAVNAPVPFNFKGGPESFVALTCFNKSPRHNAPQMLTSLTPFADIASDLMSLMSDFERSRRLHDNPISRVESNTLFDVARRPALTLVSDSTALGAANSAADSDQVVGKFLSDTLIKRRRLRSRNSCHYLALRSWAKPIKAYQISALRALKAAPPLELIEDIAAEMASAFRAVHGHPADACVVPVPCGHSGPDCLSAKLAQSVARQLNLECVEAFFCMDQRGTSHPKTNLRRPKMRLKVEIDKPVILIDDVATSGVHIEEAARLLLQTAPTVWPMVWISD